MILIKIRSFYSARSDLKTRSARFSGKKRAQKAQHSNWRIDVEVLLVLVDISAPEKKKLARPPPPHKIPQFATPREPSETAGCRGAKIAAGQFLPHVLPLSYPHHEGILGAI